MNRNRAEGSALRTPVDNEKFTWKDYLSWPENEKWELIDGIAYNMSPSPPWQHQQISMNITLKIGTFLDSKPCRLFAAPTDVKFSDKNQDIGPTVFQPDLVIEIISTGTLKQDEVRKKAVYEPYGVKEYWIVHPGLRHLNFPGPVITAMN